MIKEEKVEENNFKDDTSDYFKYSFENVQRLAEFADNKANTLITVHSIILTLFSGIIVLGDVKTLFDSIIDYVVILLILIPLIFSFVCSLLVVIPRIDKNESSLFYYMTIAGYTSDKEFFKSFNNKSKSELGLAIASQAYEVSKIVKKKMDLIRKSIFSFFIFIIFLIIGSFIIINF